MSLDAPTTKHFIYILEIDGKEVASSHFFSDVARVLEEEVQRRTKGYEPVVVTFNIKHEVEKGPCGLFRR